FSPNGLLFATASGAGTAKEGTSVQIWDANSGKLRTTLQHGTDFVDGDTLAFSPDGTLLASGSADASYGGTVRLWDVSSSTLKVTLQAPDTGILSLAFSPDGTLLASEGAVGDVYVWDMKTDKLITTLAVHLDSVTHVASMAFSPDGSLLA